MPASSENFGLLLEPGLRKVFVDAFDIIPSMLPDLYNMQSSSKAEERDYSIGGFSDFGEFTGKIDYDEVYGQYEITYTHVEYAKGFQVKRSLTDDDLYNVINRRPQALGIAARRTREKSGAEVFNNAFTDESTSGDGAELCASDHASRTPGVATQTNEGTSALSATAVESARLSMVDFRDWEGEKISVAPNLLLVPRNLEQTAWEIIASRGKVETANNNANFHFGKYMLAVWDFLTDSNNWFMIDTVLRDMFLLWFDRIDLEFGNSGDFDTLIAKYRAYMRYSKGFSDWKFIFGSLVS